MVRTKPMTAWEKSGLYSATMSMVTKALIIRSVPMTLREGGKSLEVESGGDGE